MAEFAGQTEREQRQASSVKDGFAQLSGQATSRDGGVHVTVDASGALSALELTPVALRNDPRALAAEILRCVRQAQAGLAASARERFAGNPFGERIAQGLANRFPAEAVAPPSETAPAPLRVARPQRAVEEDDDFGGQSILQDPPRPHREGHHG